MHQPLDAVIGSSCTGLQPCLRQSGEGELLPDKTKAKDSLTRVLLPLQRLLGLSGTLKTAPVTGACAGRASLLVLAACVLRGPCCCAIL